MTQELSWDDLNYLLVKVGGTIGIYTWREMSEWERLGIIWEWATKQEWWSQLASRISFEYGESSTEGDTVTYYISSSYIHPTRFPVLVVDFLREREEG